MRKRLFYFVLTCVLIFTTSCSSYLSFDIKYGYDKYIETPKVVAVENKSDAGEIEISLIAPDKCGCYLEKANQKKEIAQDVPFQCKGFVVKSDDPGKELRQMAEKNNATAYQFYVFNAFNEVAKICLEKQLRAYFKDVKVNMKSTDNFDSVNEISMMDYYTMKMKTSDKFMLVKLIALSDSGNIIEGEGLAIDKLGNGHLAWMIPVGVLTFPIGFVIGTIIFDSNYNAFMNRIVAEAIDIAAADLSKKLANEIAENPNQQFNVYVMLE